MKFSATTLGFYIEAVHGVRFLENGDPNPACVIPPDAIEISEEQYHALLDGQALGKSIGADEDGRPLLIEAPLPTAEQLQAKFVAAIQGRLDAWAQTRNYDSILSACTYATDPDPQLQAEGQVCVNLRSATWRAGYTILAQVQAGTRPMPSSLSDIEADLPTLEWPQ